MSVRVHLPRELVEGSVHQDRELAGRSGGLRCGGGLGERGREARAGKEGGHRGRVAREGRDLGREAWKRPSPESSPANA